jgi:MFS family permease
VLTGLFKVSSSTAGLYLIPFGLANFLGALLLGRLLRHRRTQADDRRHAVRHVLFASSAASAGYLTVSELFPLETRAMAIALFYAIATGIGGAVGPLLFGKLPGGSDPTGLAVGFWVAAALMAIAAVVELVLGVDAEQQSLEDVAEPLSAQS